MSFLWFSRCNLHLHLQQNLRQATVSPIGQFLSLLLLLQICYHHVSSNEGIKSPRWSCLILLPQHLISVFRTHNSYFSWFDYENYLSLGRNWCNIEREEFERMCLVVVGGRSNQLRRLQRDRAISDSNEHLRGRESWDEMKSENGLMLKTLLSLGYSCRP